VTHKQGQKMTPKMTKNAAPEKRTFGLG